MFGNVRERERERLAQARQSKHCIGGSTRREREREKKRVKEMCVCVLFEFRQFVFLVWNSSTCFKVLRRSLQKQTDRTRCLAVSILEYNLGPKITGSEVQY